MSRSGRGRGEPTDQRKTCILHVCTSCRPKGFPREPQSDRPGFILYEKLSRLIERRNYDFNLKLKPTDCLSLCPRPCGIALSCRGSWTYLFGEQSPDSTVEDILDCVSVYMKNPDGEMPRASRPSSLRSSILGRVPPIGDPLTEKV